MTKNMTLDASLEKLNGVEEVAAIVLGTGENADDSQKDPSLRQTYDRLGSCEQMLNEQDRLSDLFSHPNWMHSDLSAAQTLVVDRRETVSVQWSVFVSVDFGWPDELLSWWVTVV